MRLTQYLRPLWRNPGFTLTAILVLGLGIGANTAIFSIVRSVLLKPLPYQDPDRITVIAESNSRGVRFNVSGPDFLDWQRGSKSFAAMAAYGSDAMPVIVAGQPERLDVAAVGAGWFNVMGAKPQIGRVFEDSKENIAVISESLWRRRFAASPSVLGAKFKVAGDIYVVAGVLPAGFRFPGKSDVWIPLSNVQGWGSRSAHNFEVIGRLNAGVTVEQAQAEMSTIAARLTSEYPDSNRDVSAAVVPLHLEITENSRPTLYLLLAAVAFVLLIACANVGNLLLAQGAGRRSELAIRAALGASRAQIVRQLLSESLVLALAGGLVGTLIATWSKSLLIAVAPANIPRLGETTVDAVVLLFSVLLSVATGVLFGLIPAIQISRADLNDVLKQSTARAGIGSAGAHLRSVLVCAEIALSVVLLAGAGLAVRSLVGLQHTPTGYDSANVLTVDMAVPGNDESGQNRGMRVYAELLRRAERIPGVVAAGAVSSIPLSELGSSNGSFGIDGRKMERSQSAGFHTSSGGYFKTLGIPLLAGRTFNDQDQFDKPRVAMISNAMARKYWPAGDAIGHHITTGYDQHSADMLIVGVVGDVRHIGLDRAPRPEIYVPYTQHPVRASYLSVVVKTTVDPQSVVEPLRRELRAIDPEIPAEFATFDQVIASSIGSPRFRTVLLGIFAALALTLAVIGVYGLMAFLAVQRTPEIGLRMALGATAGSIVAMTLGRSMKLIGAGLIVGIASSYALTRYMQTMLYGIKATDPGTYLAVAAVLAIAALAASYIPAWRASRIDPVRALRAD